MTDGPITKKVKEALQSYLDNKFKNLYVLVTDYNGKEHLRFISKVSMFKKDCDCSGCSCTDEDSLILEVEL